MADHPVNMISRFFLSQTFPKKNLQNKIAQAIIPQHRLLNSSPPVPLLSIPGNMHEPDIIKH